MSTEHKTQKIYLVRHGKPELPHERMYYGRTDYPLAGEGVTQALALSEMLKDKTFAHAYSSPLSRARETMRLISPDFAGEIICVPELREIDLGEWEGKTYDEVRDEWNEIFEARGRDFAHTAPPGGESFADLQKRTVPAFEKILADCPEGDILIVAHGGVIWTIMCHYFGFNLNDIFYYLMEYCGVNVLHLTDGVMRLGKYNWSPEI